VSHGPTRRVRQLLRAGLVNGDLWQAADHEADLLAHPYVDLPHLELAKLRLAGMDQQRQEMVEQLSTGLARQPWRPRGPRSALRRHGVAQTRAAYLRARAQEDGDSDKQAYKDL
jgi:hypothetical protein